MSLKVTYSLISSIFINIVHGISNWVLNKVIPLIKVFFPVILLLLANGGLISSFHSPTVEGDCDNSSWGRCIMLPCFKGLDCRKSFRVVEYEPTHKRELYRNHFKLKPKVNNCSLLITD